MSIGWMSLIVVSPFIWPTNGSNLFISKLNLLDKETIETHVLTFVVTYYFNFSNCSKQLKSHYKEIIQRKFNGRVFRKKL